MKTDIHHSGFTLIEMLLVLAVISTILLAIMGYTTQKSDEMRRDRVVMQVQQIQNAALAYYLNSSTWPANVSILQTDAFLPQITIVNPWANAYSLSSDTVHGTLTVCTAVTGTTTTGPAYAAVIAGRLPMGYVADNTGSTTPASCPTSASACTHSTCTVVSVVNVPGQNLNNARSVNFSGVYRNGGCVPVPTCPGTMTPSIMTIPVSVKGIYDPSNPGTVFPISGFTAYAKGPNTTTNGAGVPSCTGGTDMCYSSGSTAVPNGKYWRACMQIITLRGSLQDLGGNSEAAYILAITRCVPTGEPVGSNFSVFSPFST